MPWSAALERNGLTDATVNGRPAVLLQSFEEQSLRTLATRLPAIPRTFLIGTPDAAQRWLTADGLREMRTFVTGVGPARQFVDARPAVVGDAHAAGLTVVPWTFRARRGIDDGGRGGHRRHAALHRDLRGGWPLHGQSGPVSRGGRDRSPSGPSGRGPTSARPRQSRRPTVRSGARGGLGGNVARRKKMTRPRAHETTIRATTPRTTTSRNRFMPARGSPSPDDTSALPGRRDRGRGRGFRLE